MNDSIIEYATKSESRVVRKRKTQVIEECLGEIIAKTGTLEIDEVLRLADNPKYPLHEYLDWDDSKAGIKWRRAQVTAMIIATKYVCYLKVNRKNHKAADAIAEAKASSVRRFLPAFTGTGYKDRAEVLSDEESRKFLVEKKLSVLRGWCDSVIDIPELGGIRAQVLSAIA